MIGFGYPDERSLDGENLPPVPRGGANQRRTPILLVSIAQKAHMALIEGHFKLCTNLSICPHRGRGVYICLKAFRTPAFFIIMYPSFVWAIIILFLKNLTDPFPPPSVHISCGIESMMIFLRLSLA